MKERLSVLEQENKDLKESANLAHQEIKDLKTTTVYMCSRLDSVETEMSSLKEEVKVSKCQNIRLEAYTKRKSIKIFNIEEAEGEFNEKTEELVRNMFHENLKISGEDIEQIRFECVHRIPTRQKQQQRSDPNSKPRPIIVKFSFFQDKEFVWSFVKNLKGSGIAIANDYPREIDEIHKKLYPVLKQAKQQNNTAYFKVDKLIINGQVHRGVEVNNLQYYGIIMASTERKEGQSAEANTTVS